MMCFWLLMPVLGFSQDKVLGLVVEMNAQGEETPLPGANVYWLGTTTGAVTGGNGVFILPRISGNNQLVVSYVGYHTDTVTVSGQSNVKVVLEPDEILDEVTVEGWRPTSGVDYLKGINTIEMGEDELFKAACCNLSESFDTNPSVDVSFTDAVTGTRQIEMLGLAGPNTMISVENMPGIRGISANNGLSYIPGTWINSIQVTKGTGSVVNGSESIAGQLNVELKKPQDSEKLYINGYLNESARSELNVISTQRVGKNWATTTLLHGSIRPIEQDMNDDGFVDMPVGNQLNFVNRWVYRGDKNWLGQVGVKALRDQKTGGQMGYDPEEHRNTSNKYGVEIDASRYEIFAKTGYVFPKKEYKSFGLQLSGVWQEQDSYFGFTEYDATQASFYSNLIYQTIISDTRHKVKAGISFSYDEFDEQLNELTFDRVERVPGAFFEYTYDDLDKVTVIAGMRVDNNNLFGTYLTPRLHVRYSPFETTTIRASAGKGRRTASVIAENMGVLASSRAISFANLQVNEGYGFRQDEAWNAGVNLTQDFSLNYRNGVINIDFYRTIFDEQVVLDLDRSSQEAVFSSLQGKSWSNSFQVQLDYELVKRLDIRLAYRWLDVQVAYEAGLLQKPLVPENRAFFNAGYETRNNWAFDYTVHWTGGQRIPGTGSNPEPYQRSVSSSDFITMNTQITKSFKKGWDVYVGVENITNYKQENPIIGAEDPFGPYFDSSLVWGPIFGRMTYAGFRYRIK